MQSIQDYTKMVPNGISILKESVPRLFPWDSYVYQPGRKVESCKMSDIIYEIMQKHATGIRFRERNSGIEIDSKMKSEGFNVTSSMDVITGFVEGGNSHNCGTWMDKMGESHNGHNFGVPATPRHDSVIIFLVKSDFRFS